ncbi:MAG: ORF6N domain-containing protein [Nitrospirota bacterium]
MSRFPEDFMFQLTQDEMGNWKSQIVISNKDK